ncbi:MFS transporter [Saccharopolyspora cebuensis]|uniref:MFS transporter n=1 Tax=Saccharopolyspora cebuensis TaxID=418759 RepID=A0ABV4CJN8_9PSEU
MHHTPAQSTTRTAAPPDADPRGYTARVVLAASVALALTAPGQTAALSVFIDPLIESLALSRTEVSAAYFVGSLSGAFVLPVLGRAIDRFGPRLIMAAIGAAFAVFLLASSAVTGLFGLTAAFIGLRVAGQGALNLVATTTVAVYGHRRRGFATGLTAAVGTAGISMAPLLLEGLVADFGWQRVWIWEGIAVAAFVLPAALLLLPRAPRTAVAPAVADEGTSATSGGPAVSWTLAEAIRTGMFWMVTAGVGTCSLITTGLTFHLVAVLGERGLSATEAAVTFLPQTLAGLAASVVLGWLADHFSDRALIIAMMAMLAGATAGAGWVQPGWSALAYGVALGVCANGVRTLEAVAFPRCFGVGHLGSLRGVVHSGTVAASALGPLLLALGRSWSDSYRPVLLLLCLLPAAVILMAAVVRRPPPVPPRRQTATE